MLTILWIFLLIYGIRSKSELRTWFACVAATSLGIALTWPNPVNALVGGIVLGLFLAEPLTWISRRSQAALRRRREALRRLDESDRRWR